MGLWNVDGRKARRDGANPRAERRRASSMSNSQPPGKGRRERRPRIPEAALSVTRSRTTTYAGSPDEDIDGDEIRYFLLRDLASDGAPVGVVAGMPCRAEGLENGWLTTLWAEDHESARARILNDCRGAV
jgi:hypothetical protein